MPQFQEHHFCAAPLISQLPTRKELIKQAAAFGAKKHLGQHFLVEPEKLRQMAAKASITRDDTIVEIGPGLGFLTKLLAESGAKIIAVELDRESVRKLEELNLPNVSIVHADVLKFDFSQYGKIKVVGNIPYQITSPIISHLFGEIGQPSPWLSLISLVVLTIQYEVAKRICAQVGSKDYSQITLLADYFFQAAIFDKLGSECFFPEPGVTSASIVLKPLAQPPVNCSNHKLLKSLIHAGFGQRRKMFKNNLCYLPCQGSELRTIFDQAGIDHKIRAERLSLAEFANLANILDARFREP